MRNSSSALIIYRWCIYPDTVFSNWYVEIISIPFQWSTRLQQQVQNHGFFSPQFAFCFSFSYTELAMLEQQYDLPFLLIAILVSSQKQPQNMIMLRKCNMNHQIFQIHLHPAVIYHIVSGKMNAAYSGKAYGKISVQGLDTHKKTHSPSSNT